MRYGTELSQFLRIFLPTFSHTDRANLIYPTAISWRLYNIYKDIHIKLPKALKHLVLLICYVKSQNKTIYVYMCDNTATRNDH